MSRSSATEAGVAWFRFASGAVRVSVDRIGSPGPIVVPSVSSAERAGPSDVHWDWDIVHASRGIRGIEAVRVLLVIECSVRVALEVPLEVRERAAAESSRLKLWARDVGRAAVLLF